MNKTFLGITAGLGLTLQAFCQTASPTKYAELITPSEAKKHLSILASDAFEGRETGKAGAKKAAIYLADEFRKIGLTAPVNRTYFQKVPLIEKKIIVNSFIANGKAFNYGEKFFFSGEPSSKSIKASEIVFVGYGISSPNYDDLTWINIKDKVVIVINEGEPYSSGKSLITKSPEPSEWATNNGLRIQNLLSKQPATILAVNTGVESILKEHHKDFTSGKVSLANQVYQGPSAPPVIHITPEVADALLNSTGKNTKNLVSEIETKGVPQSQIIKTSFKTSFELKTTNLDAANVLGFLEGSDLKDEVLVISAHYDHVGLNEDGPDKVFNGADDDGSGTTAVLQIAKAFSQAKKDGYGPRRSILFLGNVAEEKGLLGSLWYSDNPVYPLSKTITNLNIDMIGRTDPEHKTDTNYCYLVGSDKLSTELHKISENANATYTKFKIDYKYNDPNDPERIYYRSDHYNFAKHNIPVIFYFNGIHEDYHKPSDEISKIDFNLLTRRAKLVFYTGWKLANRDTRPKVDVGLSK